MWYWILSSVTYGGEEQGGYESEAEAYVAISRVKVSAKQRRDGVLRLYSEPFFRPEPEPRTTMRQRIEFALERNVEEGYLTGREFRSLIQSLDSQEALDSPFSPDGE